ncbi:MAG: outer membrane lipoprotein-sorting protein [Bacillota bacterium]
MNRKITAFLIAGLLIASSQVLAAPKVNEILKQIDYLTELKTDGTAKVSITQQKTGEGTKLYQCIYYRRDSDKSFLIVMTAPEVEKGNGYLRQDDNFWMYRQNTRTFQHINRDENISGTDAKGQDFEDKKLTEMYKPAVDKTGKEVITETKLGNIPVYQFNLEAKIDDVSYPKVTLWVRQDNYLPLKAQSYSLSGTLMQTAYYLTYTEIEGKFLAVKMMFIDEFEKGNKSLVEINNISLKKIDDYVFTKAYLENLSK